MSEAQARSMGYIKGEKMFDQLSCSVFRTWVRFSPDTPPMVPFSTFYQSDGTPVQIENRETSSTLYDNWKSNAVERFLKGMTTKATLPAIDQKKLLMIGAIVLGAIVGIYLILR